MILESSAIRHKLTPGCPYLKQGGKQHHRKKEPGFEVQKLHHISKHVCARDLPVLKVQSSYWPLIAATTFAGQTSQVLGLSCQTNVVKIQKPYTK